MGERKEGRVREVVREEEGKGEGREERRSSQLTIGAAMLESLFSLSC